MPDLPPPGGVSACPACAAPLDRRMRFCPSCGRAVALVGAPRRPRSRLAVAALVLGVAGIAVPLVLSVAAVGAGSVALRRARRTGREGEGVATAAVVLGAIGIVSGAFVVAVFAGGLTR